MADTYTANYNLVKIEQGSTGWASKANGNMDTIDAGLSSKEPTLTKGNLTETTSSILTITGGTNAVIGSGVTVAVQASSGATSGYLSSTDWTTFNNKVSSIPTANLTTSTTGVTVSGTGAVLSAATINVQTASGSQPGLLSSSDWTTFNGKQAALGYTAENVANKDTTVTLGTSDTYYPSQKAVKSYVDTAQINTQTGTTYTFALTDAGKLVTFGSGSATTVTIDTFANVAFPTGTQIDCAQLGAGKVTFAGAGGVTVNSKDSNKAIGAQYVGVTLIKTDTNVWLLLGDLIA